MRSSMTWPTQRSTARCFVPRACCPDENGVWHYFDMVPEETEVREGAPIYTGKVCVIGSGLKEDDLKELFH